MLLAILGAVLWYAARVAQPVPDAPAGPPTGALAMERKIVATVGMIAAMALLFMGYGFREDSRQVEAQESQLDISIGRGVTNFSSLCFPCHGEKGQGAVVPDVNPQRLAPPLNRADLRPTDPDERKKTYDFVFKTIQRGRPGTPMPAWGQTDGGTLLDEHINELALMILNGDKEIYMDGTQRRRGSTSPRSWMSTSRRARPSCPSSPTSKRCRSTRASRRSSRGRRAILQRGCGSCHTIPGIPGAAARSDRTWPASARRTPIAGGAVPEQRPRRPAEWILDPPSLKPGTAMPKLGLAPDEAAAIVSFLETLPAQ